MIYNTSCSNVDVKLIPDSFLLAPTYPFFERNWTQKVVMNVKVGNAVKGFCKIGVDADRPPVEEEVQWSKYNLYSSAGTFGIGEPFYTLTLEIQ